MKNLKKSSLGLIIATLLFNCAPSTSRNISISSSPSSSPSSKCNNGSAGNPWGVSSTSPSPSPSVNVTGGFGSNTGNKTIYNRECNPWGSASDDKKTYKN